VASGFFLARLTIRDEDGSRHVAGASAGIPEIIQTRRSADSQKIARKRSLICIQY